MDVLVTLSLAPLRQLGVQCTLSIDGLAAKLNRDLKKLDANNVVLECFFIAVDGVRDAKFQLYCDRLSARRVAEGRCRVYPLFRDSICSPLYHFPHLRAHHFPEMVDPVGLAYASVGPLLKIADTILSRWRAAVSQEAPADEEKAARLIHFLDMLLELVRSTEWDRLFLLPDTLAECERIRERMSADRRWSFEKLVQPIATEQFLAEMLTASEEQQLTLLELLGSRAWMDELALAKLEELASSHLSPQLRGKAISVLCHSDYSDRERIVELVLHRLDAETDETALNDLYLAAVGLWPTSERIRQELHERIVDGSAPSRAVGSVLTTLLTHTNPAGQLQREAAALVLECIDKTGTSLQDEGLHALAYQSRANPLVKRLLRDWKDHHPEASVRALLRQIFELLDKEDN